MREIVRSTIFFFFFLLNAAAAAAAAAVMALQCHVFLFCCSDHPTSHAKKNSKISICESFMYSIAFSENKL